MPGLVRSILRVVWAIASGAMRAASDSRPRARKRRCGIGMSAPSDGMFELMGGMFEFMGGMDRVVGRRRCATLGARGSGVLVRVQYSQCLFEKPDTLIARLDPG